MNCKYFAITRRALETNVESATTQIFDALHAGILGGGNALRVTDDAILVVADDSDESPLLCVGQGVFERYTNKDPFDVDMLRLFIRGISRSALAIWNRRRSAKIEFDAGGLFYRRPWLGSALDYETAVFASVGSGTAVDSDLVLVAFGQAKLGLPQHDAIAIDDAALSDLIRAIRRARPVPQRNAPPVATTLPPVPTPSWLTYDQWISRLADTAQGQFVVNGIDKPQRIDGPAGSGKTLSLVLKCLHALKEARAQQRSFHVAFVVFSEETCARLLDSFFASLDEDGFHQAIRGESAQSVKVTTLLRWSQDELKSIAEPYEVSDRDPAKAREFQRGLVEEIYREALPDLQKTFGMSLSHELRTSLGADPRLVVRMLQHEFGVVIKGMADRDRGKYLLLERPAIALPCRHEQDRKFLFTLFGEYDRKLQEWGVVDLDDVAISHIKLLEMPLRRKARELAAFDSVFVDEAHSFNPNELAVFYLLTREADQKGVIIAVDLPQGLGDKGYADSGIDRMVLEGSGYAGAEMEHFLLEESHRCAQGLLDVAASIYTQGQRFFEPVRVPAALRSARPAEDTVRPKIEVRVGSHAVVESILPSADSLRAALHCLRSEVLIVILDEELWKMLPQSLLASSMQLRKASDHEQTLNAKRANHYVVARPEYLHGLEFEGAVLVGVSKGVVPRLPLGGVSGAAAIYATQQAVDQLYLATTRARRGMTVLVDREPSALLRDAIDRGLVDVSRA